MKKIFIIFYLTLILTGCGNKNEKTSLKIYDNYGRDILPGDADYYYTFTGESDHFTFASGIADYRDDNAIFWIKELRPKNNDNFSATISVYFNDKHFSSQNINNKNIKESDILTGAYGKKIMRDKDGNMYGEISSFMETRPEEFEKAIKIVANYCDSKNNCNDEVFSLNVEKHEE